MKLTIRRHQLQGLPNRELPRTCCAWDQIVNSILLRLIRSLRRSIRPVFGIDELIQESRESGVSTTSRSQYKVDLEARRPDYEAYLASSINSLRTVAQGTTATSIARNSKSITE